ncbi:hypothetical protein D3C76_1425580 [compost metagenome]
MCISNSGFAGRALRFTRIWVTLCARLSVRCRNSSGCTGAARLWRSSLITTSKPLSSALSLSAGLKRPSTNTSRVASRVSASASRSVGCTLAGRVTNSPLSSPSSGVYF